MQGFQLVNKASDWFNLSRRICEADIVTLSAILYSDPGVATIGAERAGVDVNGFEIVPV